VALVLFVSAAGGASGCKRVIRKFLQSRQSQPAAEEPVAEAADPEANKLQPYIKCLNDFSGRIAEGRERYLATVAPESGPTGKEPHISSPFPLVGDPKTCADGVAAIASKEPRLPELETAGTELAAVVVRIGPLLKTVDHYYSQGDYKDDKMAKGKELHKLLLAEWTAFGKADRALRAQVETINRRAKQRRLAELEKTEGRKLAFLMQNALFQAEPVVQTGDVPDVTELPLDRYMPLVTSAEAAILELDQYATAHKEETQKVSRFSSLLDRSKSFLAAAKELGRRARDKAPYQTSEKMMLRGGSAWTVAGSPPQLVHRYNDFVKIANDIL
jgi:hypothetical protein